MLHAGSGSVGPLCVRAHGFFWTPSLERQGICPKIQGLIAMDEASGGARGSSLGYRCRFSRASSVFTSNFRHKFIRHGRLRL